MSQPESDFTPSAKFLNSYSFEEIEHKPSSAWVTHGPFAMWITSVLKPARYAELGSHYGYSFFAVCQAMKTLNYGGKAYAIDTWQGDEHAGFYNNEVHEYVKSVTDTNFFTVGEMLRMTFDDALGVITDGSLDLLLIDGLHTYEAVKHDFDTWLPKMSSRGIIMFHDIEVYNRGFGVYKLWEEIVDKYPSFSFLHGHGLGVIKTGTEPTPVDGLFELDDDIRDQVRTTYRTLGQRIELQRNFANVQESVKNKQSAIHQKYKKSFSWKITAPIRAVHSVLKKITG